MGGKNLGTSIRATRANVARPTLWDAELSQVHLVISEAYLIKWAGPGHFRSYSRLLTCQEVRKHERHQGNNEVN